MDDSGVCAAGVISAGLIIFRQRRRKIGASYWTGLMRWEAIYDGAHNMGIT